MMTMAQTLKLGAVHHEHYLLDTGDEYIMQFLKHLESKEVPVR